MFDLKFFLSVRLFAVRVCVWFMHVGAEGPISTSTHFLMTLEQNSHMKMYKSNHQKLFGGVLLAVV